MSKAMVYAGNPTVAAELASGVTKAGAEAHVLCIGDGEVAGSPATHAMILEGSSSRPEDYTQAISDLLLEKDMDAFIAESSVQGRELAASVAAILDAGMLSDISSLSFSEHAITAQRCTYGGAVTETVTVDGFSVATVSAGVFENDGGEPPALETKHVETSGLVQRVSLEETPQNDVNLTDADVVIGVGLGLDSQEDLTMCQNLANALGGALGCSRDVAEQRKWLPKENYIGITGAIIKPKMYLGIGVSGQMQHIFGIRDSKIIAAINKDKSAPIFRAADYGIVGDLHDVVPALQDALA